VSRFGDIRGQARAIALLRQQVALGRVPHALLFVGPAGVGKHSTALALAAEMNCESPVADPGPTGGACGVCSTCQRIASGQHPDVVTLERLGASQTIPIETIRRQLIPALGLPPHEARARFFLVEEATSLLGPAANCLLKTLEEPPPRTHFVLGTSAVSELLPTIRSRCQRVTFQPLAATLRAELHGDAEAAASLVGQIDALAAACSGGGVVALYRAAEGAAGDKENLPAILTGLAERLHASARACAGSGDLAGAVAQAARGRQVLACLRALAMHNAHGQLAVEDLLHGLRRLGGPALGEAAPAEAR
jgi:DNA polymerase III subunit delta'